MLEALVWLALRFLLSEFYCGCLLRLDISNLYPPKLRNRVFFLPPRNPVFSLPQETRFFPSPKKPGFLKKPGF